MIEFTLPIRTVSEANMSNEHWAKKHQRHQKQQRHLQWYLNIQKPPITLPCHIKWTRIAPRQLDRDENLPMAFKWLHDCLCDYITPGLQKGRADANPQITTSYAQEKGKVREYAIRVNII